MKKFLFMAVAAIGLLLGGCDKGDGGFDDGGDPTTGNKVKYEAILADTENFDLQVLYTTSDGAKEHQIVKSPFKFEFEAEYGNMLYISASSISKSGDNDKFSTVTVKIFENDKLMVSSTETFFANVMGFFGVEDSYSSEKE